MRGSAPATAALSLPALASLYRSRGSGTGGIPATVTTASAAAGEGGTSPVTANDSAAALEQSAAISARRGNRCCIRRPVIGDGRIIAEIACSLALSRLANCLHRLRNDDIDTQLTQLRGGAAVGGSDAPGP